MLLGLATRFLCKPSSEEIGHTMTIPAISLQENLPSRWDCRRTGSPPSRCPRPAQRNAGCAEAAFSSQWRWPSALLAQTDFQGHGFPHSA